jgi:hypothetical protein
MIVRSRTSVASRSRQVTVTREAKAEEKKKGQMEKAGRQRGIRRFERYRSEDGQPHLHELRIT